MFDPNQPNQHRMAKTVKRTTEIPKKKKRKKIKSSDKKCLKKKNKVIQPLETESQDLRTEIVKLKKCSKKQKEVIQQLETESRDLKIKNVKLTKRLKKKRKSIQELIQESTSVKDDNVALKNRLKNLKSELRKREEEIETIYQMQRKLDDLRSGKIYKAGELYILWKTVLKYWFSKPGNKVYLVTPFLDKDSLVDVYKCSESQRGELAAFCVRKTCFYDKTLEDIKTEVRNMPFVDTDLQQFNNFIDNITGSSLYFHCKFIACVHSDTAEVLQTSANFTYQHFTVDNKDSAIYSTMTKNEFQSRFLHPILLDN